MSELTDKSQMREQELIAIGALKIAINAMYKVKDFKYSHNQELSANGDTETVSLMTTCLNRIETIGFYRK